MEHTTLVVVAVAVVVIVLAIVRRRRLLKGVPGGPLSGSASADTSFWKDEPDEH